MMHPNKELFDNPVWADVWKFYTVMTSQPRCPKEDVHTGEYIAEKLMAILERRTYWHHRIEEAFADFTGSEHLQKKLLEKPLRSPEMMKLTEAMEIVRRNGFEIVAAQQHQKMLKVIRNLNEIVIYLEEN